MSIEFKSLAFAVGVFWCIISCQQENFSVSDDIQQGKNTKTISLEEAKALFESSEKQKLDKKLSNKNSYHLGLEPNWRHFQQETTPLNTAFSKVPITIANTKIGGEVLFLKKENSIRQYLFMVKKDDFDEKGNVISARFYLFNTEGYLLDALKMENGIISKRLILKKNINSHVELTKRLAGNGDCDASLMVKIGDLTIEKRLNEHKHLKKDPPTDWGLGCSGSDTKDKTIFLPEYTPIHNSKFKENKNRYSPSLSDYYSAISMSLHTSHTPKMLRDESIIGSSEGGSSFSSIGATMADYNREKEIGLRDIMSSEFTKSEMEYLKNNSHTKKLIEQLLINEDFSQESIDFAKEAIKAKKEGGEVDFPNKLILDWSFMKNERLRCVGYKFYLTKNNQISQYLKIFLKDEYKGFLKLSAVSNFRQRFKTSEGATAVTVPPKNNIIEIAFNTDPKASGNVMNTSTILVGFALIHEMVHAEIFRKLLEASELPYIPKKDSPEWESFMNNLYGSFYEYFDTYVRFSFKTTNPTEIQHELMAQSYVEIMAKALTDFDKNKHPKEFYENIAWSGLQNTTIFKNKILPDLNAITKLNNSLNQAKNETKDCTN
ncbi:hypothetical protein CAPN010_15970 [Capnocytophaga cynodegmi]|uniref:hypothetical protein n=1 Tax=Capnocytophaga cynodegmi TaxID=28189 RepID=UPI001EE344F1|nr:hypothetical protein [Capnocytophaga cynodegmi]GJQ07439.1 hypothetical protein CAPN010_15970 [Capnocytophaga cynodegmi]